MKTLTLQLATSRTGRVALHLLALCTGGELAWHLHGIAREFQHRP